MTKALLDLIATGRERGASDIHLEAGSPALFRIRGELTKVGDAWTSDALMNLGQQILGSALWQDFQHKRSADLSRTLAGVRCRINCFQTVRGLSFAIRLLSSFRNTLKDSNLHPDLKKLIEHETGLVLISGPTGSGKSTTLAALIEEINLQYRSHVLMIESPIEYFFQNRQAFIRQREVPMHSPSFEQAIIDSLREDPDVLVIGEMREPEVMRLTLNAAETGHLVLATMHSSNCGEAVSRLCNSFPADMQPSIRAQVADCLVAVICQRLQYLPERKIQVPILEIMIANTAVRASIRAGNLSQLSSAIQTGGEDGMYSFDRYRRWADQKRDWISPAQATPLLDTTAAETDALGIVKASPRAQVSMKSHPPNRPLPARHHEPEDTPGAGRIEIQIDDADLEGLAKQIADTESE